MSGKYFPRQSGHTVWEKSASLCSWMYVSIWAHVSSSARIRLQYEQMDKIPRRTLISVKEVTKVWFVSCKDEIEFPRCFSSDATRSDTEPKTNAWTAPPSVKSKMCGVRSKNQSKTITDSSAEQSPAFAPAYLEETMTAAINNTSRL